MLEPSVFPMCVRVFIVKSKYTYLLAISIDCIIWRSKVTESLLLETRARVNMLLLGLVAAIFGRVDPVVIDDGRVCLVPRITAIDTCLSTRILNSGACSQADTTSQLLLLGPIIILIMFVKN